MRISNKRKGVCGTHERRRERERERESRMMTPRSILYEERYKNN